MSVDHGRLENMRFPDAETPDEVFEAFGSWAQAQGLTLYPHQEEAALALAAGQHVIITTPTGSGKSLVAVAGLALGFGSGFRSYYTAPIKALVAQKFFELVDVFGPENVGMLTGDSVVNPDADIIACTAEILANIALRTGPETPAAVVVMDEFHYYADPQRGWAWQVPLLELPDTQFILASATLGDVTFFAEDLTERTGREVAVIGSTERPVPLTYEYSVEPLPDVVKELIHTSRSPTYLVHFTQAAAVDQARLLAATLHLPKNPATTEAIGSFRFSRGFGTTLSRLLRAGVGIHHAGMLPRYRRLVERLAQDGLLPIICGTDTLGVGINVPIRTVVLTGLAKFDGERFRHLTAREFHQIGGRAGRAGYDDIGEVIVSAPDHVIENRKALAKAGDDPKKIRKIVRKKAPPGQVNWTEATFERLRDAPPEPLASQFRVTHAMVLEVLRRPDPIAAMTKLLTDNHEAEQVKMRHVRQTVAVYRSLRTSGLVERPRGSDDPNDPRYRKRGIRLTVDLPDDFALNQDLSPFAVAALDLLNPDDPDYALDVVSLLEATLEDPRQVLRAQEKAARGTAIAQMKADGIEYEERMRLLEDVSYPKPLAELLEPAFEMYARTNPWARDFELSCKSVVREMFERAMTFHELISAYDLQRSEGVVLRYLSDAYRALSRTVPPSAWTDEFEDLVAWLGVIVRSVDASLLEEWTELAESDEDAPVAADRRALRVLVRNALFRRLELAQFERWDALAALTDDDRWPAAWWQDSFDRYFEVHHDIGIDTAARSGEFVQITESPDLWEVVQVVADPDGDHDWRLVGSVDVTASELAGEVVFTELELIRL
jgi:superfamily II RNA helicase